MWVVAVTGGIGSGKTTVAKLFGQKGIPYIDTDIIAREIVGPGTSLLQEIITQFGPQFVTANGELNRPALREYVFTHEAARRKLESLLHPAIRTEVQTQIAKLDAAYCLVLIPLLAYNPDHYQRDRTLFVDAPEPIRIERSAMRDKQSEDKIKQILVSQPGREQMAAIADDILDNSGDLHQLSESVAGLHRKYLELAKAKQSQ